MDQRLFVAAHTGNLLVLDELLAKDPLILEKACLGSSITETPLHVAVLAGKIDFTKEIVKRKPEFATDLNKDGFSPIHLASVNRQLEIVKELLKRSDQVGHGAVCLLKDGEGRTPLHCAVIKGRIHVIGELLYACPDSVREITARCETVLHLAVRNNQSEALKILVERLIDHGDDQFLNTKDWEGNTVLHLAISRKQHLGGARQNNPPDHNSKSTTRGSSSSPNALTATVRLACYISFMIYNTMGFLMSLIIIYLLTSRFPLESWLRVAVVSMLAIYVCGVCFFTLTNHHGGNMRLLMIMLCSGAIIGWKFWWIRKWAMIIQTRRRQGNDLNNDDSSFKGRII